MIDLYFWTTPNGYKPLIFMEEAGMEYNAFPVNIGKGEQFAADFLKISPNNKIPALVDDKHSIFESGAILMYLAEKSGKFMPNKGPEYYNALQWLMWQIGGLGPMMGQAGHFRNAATEEVPYAKTRYMDETHRLLGVLDKQLEHREFITGDYSIADIACYPWVFAASGSYLGIDLSEYANVMHWSEGISKRPAVMKVYEKGQLNGN